MGALMAIVMAAVAASLVIGLVGMVVSLMVGAVVMAIKLIPLFLIGYVVVKLVRRGEASRPALRRSDSAWLDTRS
jgi:hypothetical protein